jgi:hypothetical protein
MTARKAAHEWRPEDYIVAATPAGLRAFAASLHRQYAMGVLVNGAPPALDPQDPKAYPVVVAAVLNAVASGLESGALKLGAAIPPAPKAGKNPSRTAVRKS